MNVTDMAGVYQFENVTTQNDATVGDVVRDLQYGDTPSSSKEYASRTLRNVLAVYDEAQTFLSDLILCGNEPIDREELRRHLLASSISYGEVRFVISQSVVVGFYTLVGTGVAMAFDHPLVKLGAAEWAALNIACGTGLLGLIGMREEQKLKKPSWPAYGRPEPEGYSG